MRKRIDPKKAPKGRSDWARIRAKTDEEIEAGARSDPDFVDVTELERVPNVFLIRRRLHLTQEAFADRFGIPVTTIRDWEQGRSRPEKGMRSYLRVIERIPDRVEEALQGR